MKGRLVTEIITIRSLQELQTRLEAENESYLSQKEEISERLGNFLREAEEEHGDEDWFKQLDLEKLGSKKKKGSDWIQFQVGESALVLRPLGEAPHARRAEGLAVQLGFRVRSHEVDACYEHLKAAGVEALEPPSDQGWGRRTLFFKDPEGNLLEVYANLAREFGD